MTLVDPRVLRSEAVRNGTGHQLEQSDVYVQVPEYAPLDSFGVPLPLRTRWKLEAVLKKILKETGILRHARANARTTSSKELLISVNR